MMCAGMHTMELYPLEVSVWEGRMFLYVPALLILAGIVSKLLFVTGVWEK